MNKKEIRRILNKHKKWSNKEEGGIYADLSYADLRSATLSYADLSSANLRSADLSFANLRYATLSYADLRSATLSFANLSFANLSYADLSFATLSYADLSSADLSYAVYSILNILRINWGKLPDNLKLELMRHDALICGIENMNQWADSDKCPYNDMERDFNFVEDRKLWNPGKPELFGIELFRALCIAKKIKIKLPDGFGK